MDNLFLYHILENIYCEQCFKKRREQRKDAKDITDKLYALFGDLTLENSLNYKLDFPSYDFLLSSYMKKPQSPQRAQRIAATL